MDVVASAQAAAALAGMFLEIVQVTKHAIETMKGARTALVEMFTRAERIRLNLELFRALTNRLSDPTEKNTALSFNESAYRQTASEVLELVRKVADSAKHHDFVMKVNWLFYRSDVAALVKKLEERERDLGLVLTFIAAVEERTKVSDTFSNVLQGEGTQIALDSRNSDDEQVLSEELRPMAGWTNIVTAPPQTPPTLWPGVLIRESFTPAYLEKRDKLAEASYLGDWATVLKTVDEGKKIFNESWPNTVRLRMYRELSKSIRNKLTNSQNQPRIILDCLSGPRSIKLPICELLLALSHSWLDMEPFVRIFRLFFRDQ
ncbi:hypothetical protein N7510_003375 [Penicillium lagena]|uniref:uncharacterized protein n=1 Tax=Penicillium lagena TaxID=94218 RepID=UPI00253F6A40|nr:uncharacterized protein N7510_003375 [Penicillium lagena]KAJ5619391.1 hypothetical protein N7510_003375 [Penicillium lagena]